MAIFKRKSVIVSRRRRTDSEGVSDIPVSRSSALFQRNRTLTGSTSNHITQSQGLSAQLESPRTHVHHLTVKRRKVGSVLLGIIVLSSFLFWILTQFTARVTVSFGTVALTQQIDRSMYENVINDYLGANPFARLRFALDPVALSSYVSTRLPEVAAVSQVGMVMIGETHFDITIRHPVAGWTLNRTQYFVDDKGIAFQRNYFATPSVQIVDDSGISLEQGATIASNRFLGFVGRVVAFTQASGYVVTQAIIPTDTTRQLEIKLNGVVPLVKLSIDRPAGEQVEDMVRAVKYLVSQAQTPSYIDVRVSGKAFYK